MCDGKEVRDLWHAVRELQEANFRGGFRVYHGIGGWAKQGKEGELGGGGGVGGELRLIMRMVGLPI